ncbi:protein of unknown function [Streptococcus henryi]|uniref:DUF4391 domain-containing protein n=1 Tax=Streptococcus henryi TaxID=439219 RepID=A0A1G6B5U0_9STRE|nr:DUF4391 domain-containing protein [Streptococcus henryi]SDB15961.1 protein of unknown function [Streptococcus henryi]
MTNFPQRSQLPKPRILYKPHQKGNTDFFEKLSLSTKEKQELRAQIVQLSITHVLDSQTTNIPDGQKVKQIMVIEVKLKSDDINLDLLKQLDQRLGMYLIFQILLENGRASFLINYKEPLKSPKEGLLYQIVRSFKTEDDISIDYGVNTLDELFGQLVKEVAQDKIIARAEEDISSAIVKSQEIEQLEKKAGQLKKKMYAAKSMRQQMDYKKAYQQVLADLEKIKTQ